MRYYLALVGLLPMGWATYSCVNTTWEMSLFYLAPGMWFSGLLLITLPVMFKVEGHPTDPGCVYNRALDSLFATILVVGLLTQFGAFAMLCYIRPFRMKPDGLVYIPKELGFSAPEEMFLFMTWVFTGLACYILFEVFRMSRYFRKEQRN